MFKGTKDNEIILQNDLCHLLCDHMRNDCPALDYTFMAE